MIYCICVQVGVGESTSKEAIPTTREAMATKIQNPTCVLSYVSAEIADASFLALSA